MWDTARMTDRHDCETLIVRHCPWRSLLASRYAALRVLALIALPDMFPSFRMEKLSAQDSRVLLHLLLFAAALALHKLVY